jgi:hypothetical protein
MPFSHLITLISNAHLIIVRSPRRLMSSLSLGVSLRVRRTPQSVAGQPFVLPGNVLENGHVFSFLRKTSFHQDKPGAALRLNKRPKPCRGQIP